jgi:hypothetical protein
MKLGESPSRFGSRSALLILAVALLFSAFVRWRLREMPLERDEGGMAYMAQLLLQGIPPYQEAYHEKLPGIYLAYAALMAAFGQSASGIHLGLMVVNLATIVLVFLLARDLFDSLAGGIAAAAYSLLAVSPSVLGTAAHATHFVTLFGVAAAWALWRALQSEKIYLLFISGMLFGTAFLMKQHGAFLSGFGALMILIHYARLRPFSWRQLWRGLAVFAAGVVLPYAGICLWLWWAGAFDRFWLWTVTYSRSHVSEVSLASGAIRFGRRFIKLATPNWPLLILAMLGARIVWTKSPKGPRWFSYAFFAFSFLCLCPGFFFREHYFIVWLPAVSIFSGVGGSRLLHFASRWRSGGQSIDSAPHQPADTARRARRNAGARAPQVTDAGAAVPGMLRWLAATMLLVAAAAFSIWWQRDFFFLWTPTRACQETYSMNPFVESCVIADYLRDHTTPDQRVAVLGSEPQVYFYAKRRAATGHIYAYPLVERQPFALQMQREMCREIGAAKPAFLVYVHVAVSWLADPDSSRFIYEWLGRYVESYYRPVGLADIVSRTQTDYQWGDQAAHAHPRSPNHVWILQRKE